MSPSMTKLSHSAESSEYSSENSATQISQQITDLTLSGRESESTNGVNPQTDTYNSHIQRPTRSFERLRGNPNSRSSIDAHYNGGTFNSDGGPPRKRFKSNITEPDYHAEEQGVVADGHVEERDTQQIYQNGNSLHTDTIGTPTKTSEILDRNWSGIFSENRKLAVVIDNRSRSTSTSTNGQKGHNSWSQKPTVKGSQETSVLLSRTRHQASLQNIPPPTYQDCQPIIIDSDDDEAPGLPQKTHQIFPSETKPPQEFEEELTDAPMSLDSTEVYSPLPQECNIPDRLDHGGMTNAAWPQDESMGFAELQWRPPGEENRPTVEPGGLRYSPDVENSHLKITNGHYISPEYRESSSPPYSPPPPDVPEVPLELVNLAESYISPPHTTIQDDQPIPDDGFVCRICTFYIENNGQYKDKLWYRPDL